MEWQTQVALPQPTFQLEPQEQMLCVGSCFADRIGALLNEDGFRITVNPYGVMYNPVSILHTVSRLMESRPDYAPRIAILTLGTNHVYRLKSTGEIVDNCRKQPARLFEEEELDIDACTRALASAVEQLRRRNPDIQVLATVSPIRYAKYGFHGSQLSKATLLLAADRLCREKPESVTYFPAYELMMDQLRDYRFYAEDMLHPSAQAVAYIYERFGENYFSDAARTFLKAWRPLRTALRHRPFNPDSEEYRQFMDKTMLKIAALSEKYPNFAYPNHSLDRQGRD
ncbi:MAG: GSCFA domain-containing protein [Prevotella sp.]|nr:GSCFA domain-containing protein [Prevotella sp.]